MAAAGAVVPAKPAVPAAPPFRVHSLGNYDRYLKVLPYGDYGTGKTKLAATAALVPQMCDVLMIDAESGDLTIKTESEPAFRLATDTHMRIVKVKNFNELARVHEYLKVHCRMRDAGDLAGLKALEKQLFSDEDYDVDAPPFQFQTVIVDSLSEIESFTMYQLLGVTISTRLDQEVAGAEWAEYKRLNSMVLRMIRAFRDLPMHVIMPCAAGFIVDEQKRQLWQPALTGKLSKQCQAFMDIVGYMRVETDPGDANKKNHILQVQPSARINAKCRFSNFKQIGWSNPTMKSILESVGLLEKPATAPAPAPAPVKK